MDLFQIGKKKTRNERRGQGDIKRIKISYIYTPAPHNECDHYILPTCTNNNKNFKNQKYSDYVNLILSKVELRL